MAEFRKNSRFFTIAKANSWQSVDCHAPTSSRLAMTAFLCFSHHLRKRREFLAKNAKWQEFERKQTRRSIARRFSGLHERTSGDRTLKFIPTKSAKQAEQGKALRSVSPKRAEKTSRFSTTKLKIIKSNTPFRVVGNFAFKKVTLLVVKFGKIIHPFYRMIRIVKLV